jgi:hypothetical protein|mmetsp:Transcript_20673/g.30751  ORF Transcript_20673/g.30751 Transcript_20673/m.30751 type:complete len:161 (-) Transcript_20673:500-982(-)
MKKYHSLEFLSIRRHHNLQTSKAMYLLQPTAINNHDMASFITIISLIIFCIYARPDLHAVRNERRILGCCDEVRPSTKIFDDDEEEDEVETFTPPPSDISCFLQHQATMKLLLKIISYCRFDKLHLVVEGLVQLSGPVQLPLPRYLPETHIAHLYKSNEY